MIELVHGPLDVARCIDYAREAGSGGIVTFIGCVREISDGKNVSFLQYEAYEPMALEKLHQVVAETRARWPVRGMAIQHRLGRLEIGEDAVVIVVSCPHRSEAFDACRYAIDRLKEIVPIWKKEHGEGGEEWVGGPTLVPVDSIPDRARD